MTEAFIFNTYMTILRNSFMSYKISTTEKDQD
jgi:hypothetical protein